MEQHRRYHHGDLRSALIRAGIEVLAEDGLHGLSLRKVARRAGVSHAAPYAHFADKQALVAAISAEGFREIQRRLSAAIERHPGDPQRQLFEAAWAYIAFALSDTAWFRLTFSDAVEREQDYPAYLEISAQSYALVVALVETCQQAGILKAGPPDVLAVTLWALVHGLVSLVLERLTPNTILDRHTLKGTLVMALNQLTLVDLDPQLLAAP